MRTHRFAVISILLALVAGCSDSTSPGPGIADEATSMSRRRGRREQPGWC